MEIQDFSPSARNDRCVSRLRLERIGVSPALQALTPPLRTGGNANARFLAFGSKGQLFISSSARKDTRITSFSRPPPLLSEPVGMEIQDFSPSARNDRCVSRLRLERIGVSPALQALTPPLRTGGNANARFLAFGSKGQLFISSSARKDRRITSFSRPPPLLSEPVGMEIQDFSPSARNDRCVSRLRLERIGVSPALQALTPPLRTGGNANARFLAFGSKRQLFISSSARNYSCLSRPRLERIGVLPAFQGPHPASQNRWEWKFKISRLRLEMTGVYLVFGSKG